MAADRKRLSLMSFYYPLTAESILYEFRGNKIDRA